MFRLIQWILGVAFTIGVGSALVDLTYKMTKAAAHAHQHDQMSYAKFTRALFEAKPRQKPIRSNE